MDKDLETCENYFSLDPNKLVQVGNDYYTTLRTSWNILFNPEQMTPYVVTSVDETDGTFEMEPITGNIIPAGTPVIIKTSSTDVEENRMVPTKTNASSGAVPTGNLLQSSVKYFPNQTNSNSLKPLKFGSNGRLTFGGSAPSNINGNEAYLGVTNDVSLKPDITEVTLAELLEDADMQKTYRVTDLTLVNVIDNDRLLICKDNNGAEAETKAEGEVDYMNIAGFTTRANDHSNWVGLILPEGETANNKFGSVKQLDNVVGKLIDAVNPTMQLEKMPETSEDATFAPNVYIAASFAGTQQSPINQKTYFLALPRPMELAQIEWAQWNGINFVTPERQYFADQDRWVNELGLSGEFDFSGAYLQNTGVNSITNGNTYSLPQALIKVKPEGYDNFNHIYVLGNVNNLNSSGWTPNKGVEMFTADGVTYTTTLTVNNSGDGYGYFSFSKKLAENNDNGGWNYIAPYRFGAVSNGDFEITNQTLNTWHNLTNDNYQAYKAPTNKYTITINLSEMKVKFVTASNSNSAPRRAGTPSTGYLVYPLQMQASGYIGDNVYTGVTNVKATGNATEVARYNVAGQRVRDDYHGIVIVLMSDGTAHKVMQ
ncbi:MAG: hypothetical protein J5565_03435 [Muribaculaceae bacterium]|nr:hypothetical protein [Muribaculaceae bacterium]